MSDFLTPAEVSNAFIGIGKKKASIPGFKLLLLGILAGVFIGFAAHLATTVATGWTIGGASALFGLKKFFVGAVFSVGLMLVMIPGSELWTGNNLMTISLFNKDITLKSMMRNWVIVYIGNLIGSILLAWMIAKMTGLTAGAVGSTAINIAAGKCSLTPLQAIFRAIGCNILVVLAVMMAVAAKKISGKILAIFFPIMAFVTAGFEHSIANMYFLPAGLFSKTFTNAEAGADQVKITALTIGNSVQNIALVSLGNFIGGAILISGVYWFLYVRKSNQA
ncbi:MAG: formate/nitrite transporter family protein [Spirochaetes bacterium]|nr:formate/nitrite transporter family protein [Spirochaetota bacterium]